MGLNAEDMIKGRISETIVEEMLVDLGFFVSRLGMEYSAPALTTIQRFIEKCGGNFRLDWSDERSFISHLPDFIMVDKKGKVKLVEVKFRWNGTISQEKMKVFFQNPYCIMIVVNLEVNDKLIYEANDQNPEQKADMSNERFLVWKCTDSKEVDIDESNTEVSVDLKLASIRTWLKDEFDVENEGIINKYQDIVKKWLSPALKHSKEAKPSNDEIII